MINRPFFCGKPEVALIEIQIQNSNFPPIKTKQQTQQTFVEKGNEKRPVFGKSASKKEVYTTKVKFQGQALKVMTALMPGFYPCVLVSPLPICQSSTLDRAPCCKRCAPGDGAPSRTQTKKARRRSRRRTRSHPHMPPGAS